MTGVGEDARSVDVAIPARPRMHHDRRWRGAVRPLAPVVPWVVVVAYAATVLVGSGVSGTDVATYGAYWLLCLVAPGTIVLKALIRTSGSWLGDLALGAAVGLCLELAAWAVAMVLGVPAALRFWPLLTLALLAVPAARRRVLTRPAGSVPRSTAHAVLTNSAVAAGCLQVLWYANRNFFRGIPLPPSGTPIYQDLMWHLSLVHEAQRSFPLQTPQVAGAGPVIYHWFSDAHMAAAGLITGIDVPTVMLRLWIVPILVLTVTLTAVLTRRLATSWWAPGIAALLVSSTYTLPFWPSLLSGMNHLSPVSPSQQYSHPLVLLLLFALVTFLRADGRLGGPLALVVLATVAVSGSKSSALPIVLGGLCLAAVVGLLTRQRRLRLLCLVAGTGLATGLALTLVAGGSFDSGIQLFSALTLFYPYHLLVNPHPVLTTSVAPGLLSTPGMGPMLLVSLLVIAALIAARLAWFVAPFLQRSLRRELPAWIISGMCIAGLAAFFVIRHFGYSEYYFAYGAIPAGCVLAAWSLDRLVADHPGSSTVAAWSFGVGAVVTAGLAWQAHEEAPVTRDDMTHALTVLVAQVAVGLVLLVALTGAALVLARRGNHRFVAAPMALLTAALVVAGPLRAAHAVASSAPQAPKPVNASALAQSRAGLWIDANVPQDALIATNVHCLNPTARLCDSRQWWITGLGGRRALVESWGYVPEDFRGFSDPELLALNDRAFTNPDAATIAELRRRGVTWLVSDSGVRPAPKALDAFATPRFRDGPITVYQLDGGAPPS
jgi:hypothetical protein